MQMTTTRGPTAFSGARRPAPLRRGTVVRAAADGSDDPGEAGPSPLLNAQFMGVLQQSLARQGADALTRAPAKPQEPRVSAVEEVLQSAVNQSKQTLRSMHLWRQQIDAQIVAQEKQVERMEFALTKVSREPCEQGGSTAHHPPRRPRRTLSAHRSAGAAVCCAGPDGRGLHARPQVDGLQRGGVDPRRAPGCPRTNAAYDREQERERERERTTLMYSASSLFCRLPAPHVT